MRIVSARFATTLHGKILSGRFKRLAATAAVAALLLFSSLSPDRAASATAPANSSPAPTCATCHAGVAASYAHAAMQHALLTPDANPVLEEHPNLTVKIGNYSYTVETRNGQSAYTVSDGIGSITLPIHWIFGRHSQTWVLERDGVFYESQVSFFRRDQALATTPGHANIVPHSLAEAIGRRTSHAELLKCFNCHSTDATEGARLTLDKLSPGLSCERCHEGAGRHMTDAIHDNFTTLPRSLKAMNAEDTANFCGQCHRTWDTAIRNHWHGPADVRFQPYRLMNSQCFLGSDPRISCTACHDPHKPVETNLASYDAKCMACHGVARKSDPKKPDPKKPDLAKSDAPDSDAASSVPASIVKTCTVAKANCASCHMPKIELPEGHAAFTDHEIRIVRPNEPYPD